jgi:hypothetical protein
MTVRRVSVGIALVVGVALLAAVPTVRVRASSPSGGSLSPGQPFVRWSGGPLTGTTGVGSSDPSMCTPTACDTFSLRVSVTAPYWAQHPGGVVVRTSWTNPDNEMDLYIFDAKGNEVARSDQLHTNFQQALLPAPAQGTYEVKMVSTYTAATTYHGEGAIVEQATPHARTVDDTMRFAPPTLVDPQMFAGEPSLRVDRDGRVFVSGNWALTSGTSLLWRSINGGRTFDILDDRTAGLVTDPRRRSCTPAGGGGDSDIAVDRTGRVYFADLEPGLVSVGSSVDHGDTWTCNALSASTPEVDRPWLAPAPTADGEGPAVDAYLSYRDLLVGALPGGAEVKPIQVHVDVTRDGGKTWSARGVFGRGLVDFAGPAFTAQDGTFYQVFEGDDSVWIARSTNQGRTFQLRRVSRRLGLPRNPLFVSGDVDAAGNVYAAWVDRGTFDVLYSYSRDKGEHWSQPVRVNPPTSTTAVMPWLSAGKAGDVAIAWYGTSDRHIPDDAPPTAPWYAWVARSVQANAPSPNFQVARLSETPMHYGKICAATGCAQRLNDFFQVRIAPDGAVVAAFDDNGRKESGQTDPGPYVVFARQVSGLGMSPAPLATRGEQTELTDGGRWPTHSKSGREIPQLKFTALPSGSRSGGTLHLSFSISSAKSLSAALAAANSGLATDVYWIELWKANDRVEYAGMHVSRSGTPDFFGGTEPVGVTNPADVLGPTERYASYPPTFALSGRVDPRSGTVTIDVPLATYRLAAGSVLHGLQAFSMTGLLRQRTMYNSLQVIDSTPSQTAVIR